MRDKSKENGDQCTNDDSSDMSPSDDLQHQILNIINTWQSSLMPHKN